MTTDATVDGTALTMTEVTSLVRGGTVKADVEVYVISMGSNEVSTTSDTVFSSLMVWILVIVGLTGIIVTWAKLVTPDLVMVRGTLVVRTSVYVVTPWVPGIVVFPVDVKVEGI